MVYCIFNFTYLSVFYNFPCGFFLDALLILKCVTNFHNIVNSPVLLSSSFIPLSSKATISMRTVLQNPAWKMFPFYLGRIWVLLRLTKDTFKSSCVNILKQSNMYKAMLVGGWICYADNNTNYLKFCPMLSPWKFIYHPICLFICVEK